MQIAKNDINPTGGCPNCMVLNGLVEIGLVNQNETMIIDINILFIIN